MTTSRHAARRARIMTGGLVAAAAVGCGNDSTLAPGTALLDAETGYWSLTVNHEAVTLSTVAPYDTVRLVPTPRDAAGAPLAGVVPDSVVTTYTLGDATDTSLVVSPDGLVRARYEHDGSSVIVRTTVRGLTRADTIPVNVTATATPPQVQTFTVQATPDTLTATLLNDHPQGSLTAQALDALGQEIPNVAVKFSTTNPHLLDVVGNGGTTGSVAWRTAVSPDQAWVRAEATIYGMRVVDSVPVTVTTPGALVLTAVFGTPRSVGTLVGHFEPALDTVRMIQDPLAGDGATLWFVNTTTTPIDVVFDNPDAFDASPLDALFGCEAQGGNIPAFVYGTEGCFSVQNGWRFRRVTTPGTYHYRSVLYGTSGTVVVVP